jgi:hypothetical protein
VHFAQRARFALMHVFDALLFWFNALLLQFNAVSL